MAHRSVRGNTNYKESSNLHSYIHRLRNKLEADSDDPHYLMSEPGVGYFFRVQRTVSNPALKISLTQAVQKIYFGGITTKEKQFVSPI